MFSTNNFVSAFNSVKNQFFGKSAFEKNAHREKTTEKPAAPVEVDEAVGVVTYAGHTQIGTMRGKPYKTFSVKLMSNDGEKCFHGVDLAEKYSQGCFSIGQKVHIKKTVNQFIVDFQGKQTTRKKNTFEVVVVNRH